MTLEEKYHKAMLIVSYTTGALYSEDIQNYVNKLEQCIVDLQKIVENQWDDKSKLLAKLEQCTTKLESPKLCRDCQYMGDLCGETVCEGHEFTPATTPDTVCFMGFKRKDSQREQIS